MDMDMDMDVDGASSHEVLLQSSTIPRDPLREMQQQQQQRANRYPAAAYSSPSAASSSSSSSSSCASSSLRLQPRSIQQSLGYMAVGYLGQAGPSAPWQSSSGSSSSSSSPSSSSSWSTQFMRRTSSSSTLHHSDALSPPITRGNPFPPQSQLSEGTLPAYSSARYPILAVCETDDVTNASGPHPHRTTRSASLSLRSDPQALADGGQRGAADDEGRRERSGDQRPRRDKQTMDYVIRSGIAGGVAGCVAKTAIAPLDRVKILFQAQNPEFQKYSGHWLGVFRAGREIASESGVGGLFRGHSATLMRIFPYAAIKYMAYDKLHFLLMPTRESETSARLFLAGATSGVLSVFLTYPLELIRVRLAFETKRRKVERGSLRRIVRQIYTEGTTEAPFSGDARRRAAAAAGATKTVEGGAASATGSATGAATMSIEAAQNRALAQGATASTPVPPSAPTASVQTANSLLKRFPMMKFYRGFSVTVLGMVPYAGTSFLVFGRCKSLLQNFFGVATPTSPSTPTPRGDSPSSPSNEYTTWRPSKTSIDLTSGALAGAISQTAAYPFEVVRRRQQVAAVVRPGTMVGFKETVAWIWKTGGWRGFYTGLSIGFLKVVPMTSISFAVWLGMKRQMDI
ncbi:mitochondrial carrier [Microstroma glucosiphilum]|uniref:Mitochondrial carrier n=1 Tax=Pseudomicrostroma glucosiphilum TaxID=1684307 RepID=A0A316U951_9BASI|nr:mitochondrial carrier [Pseudomicrostroma glucosiphilum]PWN21702.1 mitochondrial carrier [Pseudomicrostroma glucosiphilum]